MIPAAYVVNPLVDAVILTEEGFATHINVASYSRSRGFAHTQLALNQTPGFDAALRLVRGEEVTNARLTPDEVMTLWQAGLILMPQECARPFASPKVVTERDTYDRHGYLLLPELVTPEALGILTRHYRESVAAGRLTIGDRQANRHRAHNDAAGRVTLRALRQTVERIVGKPIKCSYAYASLYRGGTDLPAHRDRPQCCYTVSLQIDHQPLPPDGRSPWPLQLHLDHGAPPTDCFQPIGGGILFRGTEIAHGRPPLPPDQASWLLLLHYVDHDFDGPLD